MDDYEKYLESKENKEKTSFQIFNKTKPIHILYLAVLFLVGTWIAKSNSGKWVYVVLIVLVVLYFFSLVKQEPTQKIIPRSIAQEIAKRDLILEISSDGSYVQETKIFPTSYFRDQAWDSGEGPKIFKYHFGFKIVEPNRAPREIIYQMNPYTGEGKGIIEAPIGFSGQEIKDIQQIFPEKIIKEEKKLN